MLKQIIGCLVSLIPLVAYADKTQKLTPKEQQLIIATLAQDCVLSLTTGSSELAWVKPESSPTNQEDFCLNEAKNKTNSLDIPVSKMTISEQEVAVGAIVLAKFLPKNSQCYKSFFNQPCRNDLQKMSKDTSLALKFRNYRDVIVKNYGLDVELFK